MNLNSQIILCKGIKIDRNYKNTLSYNTQNMLSLCEANKIAKRTNYSFIRTNNSILVDFRYQDCLLANYIAFQNPDYSNKWFFAWIDEVNYKNDSTTELKFTVDAWSTWWSDWIAKQCFVLREHVNSDAIGEHTVPENLETGEFTLNARKQDFMNAVSNFVICMGVTELPDESVPKFAKTKSYNGIYGGLYYLGFSNANNCTKAIEIYDKLGKGSAVVSLFMIPNSMSSYVDGESHTWSITPATGGDTITTTVIYLNASVDADNIGNIQITRPNSINGYTPKNNKLLAYPYNYFNLTNNSGITSEFRYEDFTFDEDSKLTFWISACLTPGLSIRAIPLFYKNENFNYNYSVVGGKLPICSYNSDVYYNWLRQNGLNSVFNLVGGAISIGAGIGSGSVGGVVGGLGSIYDALHQYTLHDLTPPQAKGNTNSGDVNFADTNCGLFTVYKMCIKQEYAKIIDEFFTRFGYKINRVKQPNVYGRANFNFVQVGSGEIVCEGIPEVYANQVNQAFQNGVTIWHSHNAIGNFNVDNSIV